MVVDRFSGWFNIFQVENGAHGLVKIFTRLLQDMKVPETLTTDGGTTYVSKVFQEFLSAYTGCFKKKLRLGILCNRAFFSPFYR